jgi:thioredoxin 1
MRKKVTLGLLLAFALFSISATYKPDENKPSAAPSINFFKGSYKEALAEAKKENKLVFIDAYASWCGPCKLLKQNTFTDKAVIEYFNAHFINLSVDVEKGEGPALATKYKVTHYPTMIITDNDGKRITFTVGYIMPDDLLGFGKYGMDKAPTASN